MSKFAQTYPNEPPYNPGLSEFHRAFKQWAELFDFPSAYIEWYPDGSNAIFADARVVFFAKDHWGIMQWLGEQNSAKKRANQAAEEAKEKGHYSSTGGAYGVAGTPVRIEYNGVDLSNVELGKEGFGRIVTQAIESAIDGKIEIDHKMTIPFKYEDETIVLEIEITIHE